MKMTIDHTSHNSFTCVVTDELLRSIESVVKTAIPEPKLKASMKCVNNRSYEFDSVNELIEAAHAEVLEPTALDLEFFDNNYSYLSKNKLEVSFKPESGLPPDRVQVRYRFTDEAKYLLLKEKLNALLLRSKASYSIMTHFPITAVLLSAALLIICVVTWAQSITFPTWLQSLITLAWFSGSLWSFCSYTFFGRHKAFPLVDFRIGQMRPVGDRNDRLRQAAAWGIGVAFIVGVLGSLSASALTTGVLGI